MNCKSEITTMDLNYDFSISGRHNNHSTATQFNENLCLPAQCRVDKQNKCVQSAKKKVPCQEILWYFIIVHR